MKKEKVIELIKLAAHKHKQGKYPETLKILYPIHGKLKIEKVDKLYKSARIKTIQQLKTMLNAGQYTELKALIDSYLKNMEDSEIRNIALLTERNLSNTTVKKTDKHSDSSIPTTNQPQITKTKTANAEFSLEDLATESSESDFLIDSSDFAGEDEQENFAKIPTEKKDKSQIDVSSLEHTPAEMLGETDIFFSENPFVGDENSPLEEESFDLELEAGFVNQAEETDSENTEDVNFLIKQGVSLYEIGDLENALKSWNKALSIDKSNPILKDYIENCKKELGIEETTKQEQAKPLHKKQEMPKPVNTDKNFSKNEINRIIAIARTGEIDRAKQLLGKFEQTNKNEQEIKEAKFYINKLEEEFFVEKTLAKAEEFIENKQSEKAVKILKSLLDKFPENEKADELLALAKKRAEFDLIHSTEQTIELQLDIQEPKKQTTSQNTYKPTSVRSVKTTKSTKKVKTHIPTKPILIVASLFVIVAVLVGGYKFLNSKKNAKIVFNSIMSKITNTKEKHLAELPKVNNKEDLKSTQFKNITQKARLMYNNGKYLFAYYLYIQAEGYGKLSDNDYSYLQATKERINIKINAKRLLKKAERKFKRKKFEDAISDYYQLLSTTPDNIKFKKRLYECYLNTGIKYGLNGNCKTAKQFFEYALILDPSNRYLPKHLKTIDRCINGIISKNQVKSWFVFFR
jgi:tetratricopeptide (TPR) repeat protein